MNATLIGWRWDRRPAAAATLAALAAAVAAVLLGLAAAPAPAAAAGGDVVISARPGADARAIAAGHGATAVRDLHLIGAVAATVSDRQARALAADPRVAAVAADVPVTLSARAREDQLRDSVFLAATRADRLHLTTGASGRGVAVAVIDTGVAGDHPDLTAADGSSRVVAAVATNPDATSADDLVGHGTHVAGLVAGDSSRRAGDLAGRHLGTAPGADVVSIKVSDDAGAVSLIDVLLGLQFAVDHRAEYGIRVVNLSLTADTGLPAHLDPLNAAVQAAWNAGLVVVVAAGNEGTAPGAVDRSPANDPFVITVGALDDQGTKRTSDDVPAAWSSSGTTAEGVRKPDVMAPGAHVVGPLAERGVFDELCPSCLVDGGYIRLGGTSMAAPIVAGIAADLLERHPGWTPDEVKGALVATSRRTADGDRVEVRADAADRAGEDERVANADARPHELIDPATGDVDWTRASWTRASWTRASWTRASWTRASWTCVCAPDLVEEAGVDPARASWTRASWTRASWTRASWTVAFDK